MDNPIVLGAVAVASALVASTAASESPASNQAPACANAEHRQFDFWLGDWNVIDTKTRQPAGHNLVTLIQGDCVLQEHWQGTDGSSGTSLNIYFAGDKQWHQTWVDSNGLLLRLDGGIVDGKMVLTGKRTTRAGAIVTDRIVWTPEPNGDVRQVWDFSADDGKTWQPVFDGTYVKGH